MRSFWLAMAIVGALIGTGGTAQAAESDQSELTVAADYSLRAPLEDILPMFEKEYGAKVQVVYGPSLSLRRQIEKGAPIDVFLSATTDVAKLHKEGLTIHGGPLTYAQSSLVLVMSTTSQLTAVTFRELMPNQTIRIALADPKTALGESTARALKTLDPAYIHRSRMLYVEHSDEIVNLLQTGQADVGIVYRVDAINSGLVRIIDEAPAGSYELVQFGEAMVWTCRNGSLGVAQEFLDFMMSGRIQKLLHKYGFDSMPVKLVTG